MKRRSLYLILCFVFFMPRAFSQEAALSAEQVSEAINSGAKYASTVILDHEFKSRCDYNLTEGKWYDYEIPWHTGQIIYALIESSRVTGEPSYLDAAKKSGNFWISLEIKDHPKLKGMLAAKHGDHAGEAIVFATVSDGTAGLFKLSETTKMKKYAEVATRAGDWMFRNMYLEEEGLCYDNVDPESGEVLTTSSPFWPDREDIGLYEVARPNNEGSLFLDMYKFTGNETYKKAFINLCESLVKFQGEEGLWMDFMPNFKKEGSYHPRFNLWYAESLIDGYELTKDKRYLNAALKCARVYAKAQEKSGTIYYKNYIDGKEPNENSICGSATSFAAIIWIRLVEHQVGQEFLPHIERSADWVYRNRFSDDHPDPNLRGAFLNTRARNKKGKKWIVNRDVGTSFGLRFLAKYYDFHYGK
ncbi:glycoside hydrolase family 76 protein [Mariniphaga sediminis]|uniref:glycoside hydrolase family 76 protein n=1 Tax=Mariniphaga sediminis TaxID=1628158 RepID=UPI003561DE59